VDREYYAIGGGHATKDVLTLPVGSLIGVEFYHEGMRTAPADVLSLSPECVSVKAYPYQDKPRSLKLHATEDRHGVYGWEKVLSIDSRSGQEYLLMSLTEQEQQSAMRFMGHEKEIMAELSPKEIAKRIMGAVTTEARSARKLCELSGIDYNETVIPAILLKLREAGLVKRVKVETEKGVVRRWKTA
jgi:hypothetical protein